MTATHCNRHLSESVTACQHIAIVGGGMVGLSLALMLANRLPDSIAISLIEKFSFPDASQIGATEKNQQASFDARSTAISAGSAEILASIDCWKTVLEYAESINTIHISDRGHYTSTQLNAQEHNVDALGYVVENRSLGHVLLQQLNQSRVQVIAPATVDKCRFTQTNVTISLTKSANEEDSTSQQEIAADLLIIADGTDSPLCRFLGIDSEKTAYQQSAIIANIALEKPHHGIAYERFTDQGPLALLPLPDFNQQHRAALVWTRNTAEANRLVAVSDTIFLAELQKMMGYRAGKLLHVGEKNMYPLTLVQSSEQVRSRVVVMGNAAHFLHPVAGQGFNLSLRDCKTLVDVLVETLVNVTADKKNTHKNSNVGELSILQHYLSRRETDQQRTITLTDAMVKTFSSSELSHSVFRQIGLLGLNAMPKAKKILAQQMMGMA